MSNKQFGSGFNELMSTEHISSLILSLKNSNTRITLDNIPGKQASVKILYNIATDATITEEQAQHGLLLYGDYTEEEKQQPGSHPNIRLLMDIIQHQEVWYVEAR